MMAVLQQSRLRQHGHVLQTEDTDWMKKCMEIKLKAPDQEMDQRGLGESLCEKDCQARILNRRMLWIIVNGRETALPV